jgi:L-seryl-tRNA(Ser) seleniumtransferase
MKPESIGAVARRVLRQITRRDLFKGAGVAAVGSLVGVGTAEASPVYRVPVTTYESLGVEPVINCWGTMTMIGGSLMEAEVTRAMELANREYVYMPELIEAAGRRLAELSGAEWGCITAGAASAIWAVTAACVAGDDPEKIAKLPDTAGMKSEAIVSKAHRLHYFDAACSMVGLKLIEVDSKQEMEAAIGERTALVYIHSELSRPGYLSRGNLAYSDIISVARKHGVPTLADAAAEEPEVPNFYLESGADLVCYSGGKCLRGPQSAGFVLGRKDICMAAAKNLSPYSGIGRTQKVGKEEILGVLTALDLWVHGRDHDAEYKEWERRLYYISERITKIDGVTTEIVKPGRPSNVAPTMSISWDQGKVKLTEEEFHSRLLEGYPRIKIATSVGDAEHTPAPAIMPYQMRPGDEVPVARRMFEILNQQTG